MSEDRHVVVYDPDCAFDGEATTFAWGCRRTTLPSSRDAARCMTFAMAAQLWGESFLTAAAEIGEGPIEIELPSRHLGTQCMTVRRGASPLEDVQEPDHEQRHQAD